MSDTKFGMGFASGIGFTLAAFIFGGLAGGYFVDKYLGTKPVFTLGLFFLGIVIGFYYIYTESKRIR